MPPIPDKLDIELPIAEEARKEERTKEFIDKINKLQEEYMRAIVPMLEMKPNGLIPVLQIIERQSKVEEKPKEPTQ